MQNQRLEVQQDPTAASSTFLDQPESLAATNTALRIPKVAAALKNTEEL